MIFLFVLYVVGYIFTWWKLKSLWEDRFPGFTDGPFADTLFYAVTSIVWPITLPYGWYTIDSE